MPRTRVLICSKCHHDEAASAAGAVPLTQTDGGRLAAEVKRRVKAGGLSGTVQVCTVRCLGCCDLGQMCGAVLETPGKDTQVIGGLSGAAGAPILMAFLRAHLAVRKRLRMKTHLPNHPEWAKHFLLRIPARPR